MQLTCMPLRWIGGANGVEAVSGVLPVCRVVPILVPVRLGRRQPWLTRFIIIVPMIIKRVWFGRCLLLVVVPVLASFEIIHRHAFFQFQFSFLWRRGCSLGESLRPLKRPLNAPCTTKRDVYNNTFDADAGATRKNGRDASITNSAVKKRIDGTRI